MEKLRTRKIGKPNFDTTQLKRDCRALINGGKGVAVHSHNLVHMATTTLMMLRLTEDHELFTYCPDTAIEELSQLAGLAMGEG